MRPSRAIAALSLAAALVLPAWGAAAQGRRRGARVRVRVVEVAGGRAYLGVSKGAPPKTGDKVTLGGKSRTVVAHNEKHAVIAAPAGSIRVGQRGFARVKPHTQETFAQREKPAPLSSFASVWTPPELPASKQNPKFVPLGRTRVLTHNYALLAASYALTAPLGGGAAIGRTRLRARLHYELSSVPLHLDADGFAELWHASDLEFRPQNASRPVFTLRQLSLSYLGDSLNAAAGRLRYASRTLGMLDGARVAASLHPQWTLSAFGGVVPNPLDSAPQTDTSRFGAEVEYQSSDSSATRASLGVQGSRYLGALDEKRINAMVEGFPEFGRFGAYSQISFFDRDNLFGAATTELTAAGADLSIELGESVRLQGSASVRRPERSRYLAAYLPGGYLCVPTASPGGFAGATCAGGDLWYSLDASATFDGQSWIARLGGGHAGSRERSASQTSTYAELQLPDTLGADTIGLGVSASTGSLLDRAALDVSASQRWLDDALELSAYYRPALFRYTAGSDTFIEHGTGLRSYWAPDGDWQLQLAADLVAGEDVSVFYLTGGVSYRPRF